MTPRYVCRKIDTSRLAISYAKDGSTLKMVKTEYLKCMDDLLTTIEDTIFISVMNSDGLTQKINQMISLSSSKLKRKTF
jgi:hypothetical protein